MRLVFDRGTIVILGTDIAERLRRSPRGAVGSRISAPRCPARFHHALVDDLRRRRVRFADEVGQHPATRLTENLAPVELRPYQEAALAAWDFAGRRGTAVLPTGSGKTRLAIAAMARMGVPALCLVPTRVLLDQWARAIQETLAVVPGA